MAHKLLKSTSMVAGMTMISRLAGFARDVVLASVFGAGPAFDAFAVAFKIPNFFRRLFGEGAFAQAFVPVLADYRAHNTHHEIKHFVSRIAGTLGLVLIIVVLLAELFTPALTAVFAPGFVHDPMKFQYTTHMMYILFPYLFLIALTAFVGATLNTFNQFAIPAVTPVLLNIVMMLVAWFWAPHTAIPIYALAWGVLIAGVIQFAAQLPFLKQLDLMPRPRIGWSDPGVRRVIKLMVPAFFGVSVAQISLLIDNFFASFLQSGSISWLYYSDRFTYLPLGVIGVALATVVLPNLARQHSGNHLKEYSATLDWALRSALLIGIPAAVGLFMLSGPLIATLIHHGAFNDYDVFMTQKSLLAFSVGLPGFMLVKILASAFYSRHDIRTPVRVAAFSMVINLLFNLILIHSLKHAGLALATSLAAIFNTLYLFALLWRKKIFQPQPGWLMFSIRLIFSCFAMALLIYGLAGDLTQWLLWPLWKRLWHLFFIVVIALVVYGICLILLGMRKKHLRPPAID